MWARVTTITGDASRSDDAVRMINDEVIPRIKEMGLAARGYWLLNRTDGKAVAVALFNSEQALQESRAAAAALRQHAVEVGGTVQSVEEFEVVGQL